MSEQQDVQTKSLEDVDATRQRRVHQPPPLWPPPLFVWAIAFILLAVFGLLALRFWIALR